MIKVESGSVIISGELFGLLEDTALILKSLRGQIAGILGDEDLANEIIVLVGHLAFAEKDGQKIVIVDEIKDRLYGEDKED